ncbi:dihydroorotase [Candidatus Poriferisodalis sp.]|uniref:dihydroorotase n=1 Tax=Candidatus Poriferisodalis sp. TaxID=3101277 RepID=UPI003B024DAD
MLEVSETPLPTAGEPFVLAGGEIVERAGRRRADITVADGHIAAVDPPGTDRHGSVHVVDATGCVVASGLIDLFARLGEPGNEEAETVATGAAAAALGGFTAVLAQPDTDPPLDRLGQLAELRRNAAAGCCAVIAAATITADRAGLRLSPMAELADAGVRWFTDVCPLADIGLLRRALQYAGPLGATVSVRPATAHLHGTAAVAEGAVSARMGLAGEPAASEELAAAAAIGVARLTGGRLHLDRISAARTVELVRAAKAEGLDISASVTAEHLLFVDADADGYDTLMRAEPPYRTSDDQEALIAGVSDRTIDAVVSGHSPVPPQAKDLPFDEALPGVAALETCAAIVFGHPRISLETALDALAWRPAELTGATHLGGGAIESGQPANLAVLDLDRPWTLAERGSVSMARNTPHRDHQMDVMVTATVVAGRLVVAGGALRSPAGTVAALAAGTTR